MVKEYICPVCKDEIEVDTNENNLKCLSCNALLRVDTDAEFLDGSWHDRTTLTHVDYYGNTI
jgi:uncharacterized protein YlaI